MEPVNELNLAVKRRIAGGQGQARAQARVAAGRELGIGAYECVRRQATP
jgi:hypothetical protein